MDEREYQITVATSDGRPFYAVCVAIDPAHVMGPAASAPDASLDEFSGEQIGRAAIVAAGERISADQI